MLLEPGTRFGPYTIVESLGEGGMAAVYKAYEADLDRHVALKVLTVQFLQDATFAERFQREARVIARLEHPGIVPIFAYGIEPERRIPWMAMRLIGGGSLATLIGENRLNVTETVALIRQVAEALDYAHGEGVIHRDVKPQNILLDDRGRVYLADFGIARLAEGSSHLTRSGVISGTPEYMAPEQATGERVDHRCDIYSLGIVTYKILTGRAPFEAPTPVAMLMKHANEPIPRPAPDLVPEPLLQPLLRCLEKKAADRFATAGEFATALERGLASLTSPPTRRPDLVRVPGDPTIAPSVTKTVSAIAKRPVFWVVSAALGAWAVGLAALVAGALLLGRGLWTAPLPEIASPGAPPTPEALEALPIEVVEPEEPVIEVARASPTPPPRSTPPPTPAPTAAATPPPTPVARVPIQVRIDAAQDPTAGHSVDALYVQVLVGGQPLSTVTVEFGGGGLARARSETSSELEGAPSGAQRVEVVVSPDAALRREAARASASYTIQRGSVIPVEIRERIDGGREVRFR